MKEFLLVLLATCVFAVVFVVGLICLCEAAKNDFGGGGYLIQIECTNCDKYRFCCTRIPKGKPVPPPPYKCDVCGNMTGIRRKK